MVCCFLAAWRLLWLELVAVGQRGELAERMITWAAIGGIVGARLGFVATFPNDFVQDPLGVLFAGAGFVFLWGLIGGAGSVMYLLRKEKLPLLVFADIVAPTLCVGYAVGRIGCQLSGDGDYGIVSSLPWAMGYPLGVYPTTPGLRVHPTPVYETLMSLVFAWILLRSTKAHPVGTGWRIGLYLILSSLARFSVEFLRIEPVWLRVADIPLTQAQLVSLGLVCLGIFFMFASKNKRPWIEQSLVSN